jgi:hypothetical protein
MEGFCGEEDMKNVGGKFKLSRIQRIQDGFHTLD